MKLEMLLERGTEFYVQPELMFFMLKMLDCVNKV